MVLEFGHINYLQLRHRPSGCLQSPECFIARPEQANGSMSTDSSDSNDDLESYALFERQYVVSCVVGFFLKLVDQGAAKLNDCKGLSMERPSNSAGLLHQV
jgi:hypothetical protein